jgi:O-antigen ligase
MNLLTQESAARWHRIAWWLCVVTLPWLDMANNQCLILLLLLWIIEGKFSAKWQKLKAASWTFPFLIYYFLLLVGIFYTQDVDNGLFTLDKKVTFLGLPLVVATGLPLDEKYLGFLKKSFVYSCTAAVLLCFAGAAYYYFSGGASMNFDFYTNEYFTTLHPGASPAWMQFSYIQLAQWARLHPGYLSMYLVFCLVILVTEPYTNGRQKTTHIAIGFLLTIAIALLSTRMAIIAFFCSAAYLLTLKVFERQIKSILAIVAVSLVLLLLLSLNPVARFRLIEEPRTTTYHADPQVTQWNSVSYRLLEWQGSWSSIQSNWFAGVGTGGGQSAMNNFYAHYNSSTVGLEHNAHNQFLQVWMESGLVGLVAFLFCLYAGLSRLRHNPAYVCFILIFSLMCLTESVGERQKGVVFFMLFQVLFLGFVEREE